MKPQNIERFVKLEEDVDALAVMILSLCSTIRTLRARIDDLETWIYPPEGLPDRERVRAALATPFNYPPFRQTSEAFRADL